MSHIHTKPGQHDFTASAFIIRIDGDQPKAVVHMHRRLKTYLQFGGHVELNENPWQAITHELAEESGYTLGELQLLQPKLRQKTMGDSNLHPQPIVLHTHKFAGIKHSHTDVGFAFTAASPPKKSPKKVNRKKLSYSLPKKSKPCQIARCPPMYGVRSCSP